jgi:hypothetical protein
MKLLVLKLLGRVMNCLFKCIGMTQTKNFVLVQYLSMWGVRLEAWRDSRPKLPLPSTLSSLSNHPWKMRLQTSLGLLRPFCLSHVELIASELHDIGVTPYRLGRETET